MAMLGSLEKAIEPPHTWLAPTCSFFSTINAEFCISIASTGIDNQSDGWISQAIR
jgi:hypothetical protein